MCDRHHAARAQPCNSRPRRSARRHRGRVSISIIHHELGGGRRQQINATELRDAGGRRRYGALAFYDGAASKWESLMTSMQKRREQFKSCE
eukprot:scaffold203514_cov32-Tisochrysis_lutea.AAC.5